MDRRLIWFIILVAVAALLQQIPGFGIGGVRPNLVLIVVLALSFVTRGFLEYLILLAAAAVFINPGLKVTGAFLAVVLIAYFFSKLLPWRALLSYLFLLALSTTGFYLLTAVSFIRKSPSLFFQELFYNLVIGGLFFIILSRFYEKRTGVKL